MKSAHDCQGFSVGTFKRALGSAALLLYLSSLNLSALILNNGFRNTSLGSLLSHTQDTLCVCVCVCFCVFPVKSG